MSIGNSAKMYKIEPIVLINDEIRLPTCMYKVNNIHGGTIFSDITTTDTKDVKHSEINQQVMRLLQKPLKEFIMIEARQEKLLEQLEKLRKQMISMKQNFLISSPQQKVESAKLSNKCSLPRDIVIKANPKNPPYYLSSLQKELSLKIICHIHSSVKSLPSLAKDFSSKVAFSNPTHPEMDIVLIWKEVGIGSQLITSPTMPVIIYGDVNILRYIVMAVPSKLSYKNKLSSWEIDSALDICHKLQSHKFAEDCQSTVKLLSSKLGKNSWLSGNSMSVADVAAWTIITQGGYQSKLNNTMESWYKRCEDCNSLCLIK